MTDLTPKGAPTPTPTPTLTPTPKAALTPKARLLIAMGLITEPMRVDLWIKGPVTVARAAFGVRWFGWHRGAHRANDVDFDTRTEALNWLAEQ